MISCFNTVLCLLNFNFSLKYLKAARCVSPCCFFYFTASFSCLQKISKFFSCVKVVNGLKTTSISSIEKKLLIKLLNFPLGNIKDKIVIIIMVTPMLNIQSFILISNSLQESVCRKNHKQNRNKKHKT